MKNLAQNSHAAQPAGEGAFSSEEMRVCLRQAVEAEDVAGVQKWLRRGANAKEVSLFGKTELMRAAARGNMAVVEALIPFSDLREGGPHKRPAWWHAVEHGHLEVAQRLSAERDLAQRDFSEGTALIQAAHAGRPRCVEWLIAKIDAKISQSNGYTALMLAAGSGSRNDGGESAGLLLPVSDPLARDKSGWTALHHAAETGNADVLSLLAPVSDLDARCEKGRTARDMAVMEGRGDWVERFDKEKARQESAAIRRAVEEASSNGAAQESAEKNGDNQPAATEKSGWKPRAL